MRAKDPARDSGKKETIFIRKSFPKMPGRKAAGTNGLARAWFGTFPWKRKKMK